MHHHLERHTAPTPAQASALASAALGNINNHRDQSLASNVSGSLYDHTKSSHTVVQGFYDFDWVLIAGFMILMMQVGFAFLEAGCARYKNSGSIILKIILNTTVTILAWWVTGYAFAFGEDHNRFIGWNNFGTQNFIPEEYSHFVFNGAIATVATSIISGGTVERMTFVAWGIQTFVFAAFTYPTAAHWVTGGGWLIDQGYHDWSGAGVVHAMGGVGALVTTILLKPRKNRFVQGNEDYFKPYNVHYIGIGSLLLYACWLFYNAGTTLAGEKDTYVQGLTAANTFLAGAAGAFIAFVLGWVYNKYFSIVPTCGGLLTALVAISAPCDDISTGIAIIIGFISGFVYFVVSYLLNKFHIDDPIDAVPVHLGGGITGVLLTGFFDKRAGLFYAGTANLLGVQILGLAAFIGWSGIHNGILLVVLKGMGWLRVDPSVDAPGIDIANCGGDQAIELRNFDDIEVKDANYEAEDELARQTQDLIKKSQRH